MFNDFETCNKQYVYMKKLITLSAILLVSIFTNAQTKATKAQTIAYIEKYIQEHSGSTGVYQRESAFIWERIVSQTIYFDTITNILTYESEWYYTYKKHAANYFFGNFEKRKYEISLKDIESVNIHTYMDKSDSKDKPMTVMLEFKCTGKSCIKKYVGKDSNETGSHNYDFSKIKLPNTPEMVSSINIPVFYNNAPEGTGQSSFVEKIHKAFNHLRKLIGAAEPLEF